MAKQLPRGYRNKNPGNIEWGSPWQGLIPRSQATDNRFAQFSDAAYGIRAIAVTLTTYFDKRKARDGSKIDTVREVLERWAPPIENRTDIYAAGVAKLLNIDPDDESLNLHDYKTMRTFVESIIRHELGNPKEYGREPFNNANQWYPDDVIDEGMRRAGFVKPTPVVNKSTVTATSVAGLGAAQLADMVQPIKAAMDSAHGDISSGDWLRIAFGVGTVAIGLYMGYVAYRRHKAGQTA
ncbi:endolysin [Xanthomonas phage XAP3]|nr:endolysin [Xanthomonas phage XAP3]